jgi:hypothetical protein
MRLLPANRSHKRAPSPIRDGRTKSLTKIAFGLRSDWLPAKLISKLGRSFVDTAFLPVVRSVRGTELCHGAALRMERYGSWSRGLPQAGGRTISAPHTKLHPKESAQLYLAHLLCIMTFMSGNGKVYREVESPPWISFHHHHQHLHKTSTTIQYLTPFKLSQFLSPNRKHAIHTRSICSSRRRLSC